MSGGNGQDAATIQMVELLGAIHREIQATNKRLDALHEDHIALRAEVTSMRNEVSGLRTETHVELELLRGDVLKATASDHGERLRRLEEAVFKPAAE